MDECFGSVRISNSISLCVGGITNADVGQAKEQGMEVDGFGYYLFLSSEAEPKEPIEIIAKVDDAGAAEKLARFFLVSGGNPHEINDL